MTYEPLHHKYRPQTFADLVGQDAIATTLANAITWGRIAPAYLFTGPRGTGKTSSARILAKSLNCLRSDGPTSHPCGTCEVCRAIALGSALDVIEIDAASNTGVDNIRDLIEGAQFAPVQGRHKVVIIDECHMLSVSAFNALLKTLEEPPPHVVFVLATTDPQRVLPTIISRCQRFDFRRIPLEAMVAHLQTIAAQEAIEITADALQLVAQLAQGGLRDAESLLDQLSLLAGPITIERVWDLAGAVPEQDLMVLLEAIAANNPEALLEQIRRLLNRGREPLVVLQNLAGFYRDLLIAKTAPERQDLVAMTPATWDALCRFASSLELATILAGQQHLRTCEAQVKNTTQPRLWLEIALLGLLPAAQGAEATAVAIPHSPSRPVSVLAPPAPPASSSPLPSQQPTPRYTPEPSPSAPPAAKSDSAFPALEEEPLSIPEAAQEPAIAANANPLPEAGASLATRLQPELSAIWQQLMTHLHPLSQALLNQHGRLLTLEEHQAQVGIRSQNLAKIAQSKLPDVETAFINVLNRKVKVNLRVMTAEEWQAIAGSSERPTTVGQHQPAAQQNSGPSLHSNPMAKGSTATAPVLKAPAPLPLSSSLPAPPASVSVPEPTAPPWEEDEVVRAAKSLAQLFNGEIVDLDRSASDALGSLGRAEDAAGLDLDSDSEDEELPF